MRTKSLYPVGLTVALLLVAGSAFAQEGEQMTNEEFNVSLSRPEGWVAVDGNNRAIFNIKHEESQSQIEVIATNLMSADVAQVFYDTFHETLAQSQFEQQDRGERTFGAHTGTFTKYGFEYAGVTLTVAIFEFTSEQTAFLVVGYIKADEFETQEVAFGATVESLSLGG